MSRIEEEINDRINYIILKEVEKRTSTILEENRKSKEQLEKFRKILEHRDSFFSIMRDILANEDIDNTELVAILYCVVHEECWDFDMSKKELEIAKNFWERKYC